MIASLRRAVQANPDDLDLRLHLADVLLRAGRADQAVAECAAVLNRDPSSAAARILMARALAPPTTAGGLEPPHPQAGFDWGAAEQQVGDIAAPMFTSDLPSPDESRSDAFEVETSAVRLVDVGGLTEVKKRLEAAFLAPLRNPELRRLYGKSLRGGLLLYGPPGCGKTFIARAVAGELGAKFLSVGLADVLDMYVGSSERNIARLFDLVHRNAPCVLFLDEIDAPGQRRVSSRNNAMRGAVNQLLAELDGVSDDNDGVFVLAATNQPWDVDPALRRPGRLDRTLLVLPPDRPAREAIFRFHLRNRPVEGIDLTQLSRQTDGFSGADIEHLCDTAAERALLDSVRTGVARTIGMPDLLAARSEVSPSIGEWLDQARNVAMFGDPDNRYAELRDYLRSVKRL